MTNPEAPADLDGDNPDLVQWYPARHRLPQATPSRALGTAAIGATAVGALALGALAIGALAIGRLVVGRARFRELEIDKLTVRTLKILEP